VLVVVYTTAGDVLMLQRRKPAGYWQSVTGSLERGESPHAAAQRELREETGLVVDIVDCHKSSRFKIHPAWRDRYAPDIDENVEHVFRAELRQAVDIELNPEEHGSFRWLSRATAARQATSPTNQAAIMDLPVT
jgi:dATP pyrophosphohydrolase